MQDEINSIRQRDDIYQLWGECFGDSKEYTDFYFKWKVGNNKILTIYEDDQLISMLHLNPYRFVLDNREILSNYIVGVATRSEYRKKGFMKMILTRALEEMYEERMEFTYLMPAAQRIYSPYSFRYVYTQERARAVFTKTDYEQSKRMIIEYLKHIFDLDIEEKLLKYNSLKMDNESQVYEDLVEFADILLRDNFDCYTKRNVNYYQRMEEEMLSADGEIILLYEADTLIGYFAFMRTGDEAEVVECVIDPDKKVEALYVMYLYFLKLKLNIKISPSNKNDVEKGLTVTFLETHFIEGIESMIKEIKLFPTPIIMARIVHFEEFIKHIGARKEVSFVLKVTDSDLPQNEGNYELCFTTDGCNAVRTEKKEEITLNIADITSLLFGSVLIEECINPKKTSKEVIKKWKSIKNYHRLYINEIV